MFLHSVEAKELANKCVRRIAETVNTNKNGERCMMFDDLCVEIGEETFLKWGYEEPVEFLNDLDSVFVVEHETEGHMLFMTNDPQIPALTREHLETQIRNFIKKNRNEEGYVVLTNMLKFIRLDHEHFGFERKIDFLHAIHGIRLEQKPHVIIFLDEDSDKKCEERTQQSVIDDVLDYIYCNRIGNGSVPLTEILANVEIPWLSWGYKAPGDFFSTISSILVEKRPHMMVSLKFNHRYLRNRGQHPQNNLVTVEKTSEHQV